MSTNRKYDPNKEIDRFQASSKTAPPAGIPEEVAEYIGERPIVTGENPHDYDALFNRIKSIVAPADAIEWIWLKDVIDATWEARRFRHMRDQILELGRARGIKGVLQTLLQDKRLDSDFEQHIAEVGSLWMNGGVEGEAHMVEFLGRFGLEPSAIMAETFLNRSGVYEQLERLAVAADKRRDAVLQEIQRRRDTRAQVFRDAVDADAEDVPPEPRKLSGRSGNDKRKTASG
jgi:hypothetical protein